MLNRHESRKKIVFAIYQHLLLDRDLRSCIDDNFPDEQDEFVVNIADDLYINEDKYIAQITPFLNKWTFVRLNLVEQAILLLAASEIAQDLNDEAVIIDEAVILSKEYCDEDSYKFINGVLDRLCNRSASASSSVI